MQLDEIAFRGYKAFPGGNGDDGPLQRLVLAPLTLIFGKNNSGKSVVARLPRLILGGLECEDERLLPLKVRGMRYGGKFVELIHGGDFFGRPTFEVRARHEGKVLDFSATLFTPSAFAADEPPRMWAYEMRSPEEIRVSSKDQAAFRGLLPDDDRWDDWRQAASELLDRSIHLGPMRASIEPAYVEEQPSELGVDGREAPQWLRSDPSLADAVGTWFAEHMDGWRLTLDRTNETFRLRVKKSEALAANLERAGEGLKQVLPVVVHQLRRQTSSIEGFLDVVEQPELHLHDAAQAPLADLFINTALTGRGSVVVETHSEPLLLRVQRRVAEGQIPHDRVALYFVEVSADGSVLRPVHLDSSGEVDWWPDGVFEEDFREVAAIRRAQRRAEAG